MVINNKIKYRDKFTGVGTIEDIGSVKFVFLRTIEDTGLEEFVFHLVYTCHGSPVVGANDSSPIEYKDIISTIDSV